MSAEDIGNVEKNEAKEKEVIISMEGLQNTCLKHRRWTDAPHRVIALHLPDLPCIPSSSNAYSKSDARKDQHQQPPFGPNGKDGRQDSDRSSH
jgi:hypothetical protein